MVDKAYLSYQSLGKYEKIPNSRVKVYIGEVLKIGMSTKVIKKPNSRTKIGKIPKSMISRTKPQKVGKSKICTPGLNLILQSEY